MRILYLDLDTLRPDHLGCYGYHRNTSPNLDEIAGNACVFQNYYCSDAPCLPSRSALMTGMQGIHSGVINHGGVAADHRAEGPSRGFQNRLNGNSLPGCLRRAGFETALISPFAERHSTFQFYAGFNQIRNTGMGGMESAEHVTPTVLDWLDHHAEQDNWYLHINYWDPHTPYRVPEEFGNPFADEPLPAWPDEETLKAHWDLPGGHSAQDNWMWDGEDSFSEEFPRHPGEVRGRKGLRSVIDGYDCGIRYMDGHIGQIMDQLKKAGVWEDTIVIISADHGENFGELGVYCEHGTADHANCRIPMVVRWPRLTDGGRQVHGLHYNIDLLPTLADMFTQDKHETWTGTSYAESLRSGADCGNDQLVISQCAHSCQRAVRWDKYLYIRTYHDFYHLWPEEMLFDLEADPYETTNLAETHPELKKEGAYRYLTWHDQMMKTMPFGFTTDPMRTVLAEGGPYHSRYALPEYLKRLEETGRSQHIEALKERHPQELIAT